MLLSSSDCQVIKDIGGFYCVSSLIVYSLSLFILYWTDYYLLAGRREFLHVLIVFMIFEIVKWLYHKMMIERDMRITYKKKALGFHSLFVKCFDFVYLLKAIIVTIMGSILYHAMAVLLGAELFNKYEQTFMFSLLMSILTVFPMYLNFGMPALAHLISGLKPCNSLHQIVYRSFQAIVLGAWCGALVIPLDWDRPWQRWPVSCSFSALFACSASYFVIYCHMFLYPNHISLMFKKK